MPVIGHCVHTLSTNVYDWLQC